MQNRLTIKDIARLSGVGKSTVSRVLNNESGVSQRTRERVEAVMNQHGFSPSRSARAMRGQSDKVVAINLDPGCDMIKRADLSVIGDGAAILQALIAAVDNWRKSARRDAA